MDALVTTDWLASQAKATDLRVVDAGYFLPADGRNPQSDYEAAHIPGAIFLNLGGLVDGSSALPLMLPSAEEFKHCMGALGLGDGQRTILYDDNPYHSAARAWWMLSRVFGLKNVALLDGGLSKWKAEGRPLEAGLPHAQSASLTVARDEKQVRDKAQVFANLDSKHEQILDARGAARFSGKEADPRPSVASGHIPGSFNLPYGLMFNSDGTWKQGEALRLAFQSSGIDLSKPIVTSCGSGLTAATLVFGAHLLGKDDVALYDGSWSDWGSDPETPKALS